MAHKPSDDQGDILRIMLDAGEIKRSALEYYLQTKGAGCSGLVSQWLSPRKYGIHITFSQLLYTLDFAGERVGPMLSVLASRYHLRVIPEPEAAPSTRDIEEQVLRVVGGAGRLSCQLAAALAQDGDGGREITRREALPMLEVDDEIERLAALRAELVSVVAA